MRLIVGDIWTYVDGSVTREIDLATSYFRDGAWFDPRFKSGNWDGRVRFCKMDRKVGKYRFPTGLLPDVIQALEAKGWRYQVEDETDREFFEPNFSLGSPESPIVLRDYQQDAAVQALQNARGVLRICTGGGKTLTGASIVKSSGKRSLWFVHRVGLLHQTRRVLETALQQPIGILGDSEVDLREVTVSMVQTAYNVLNNPERELEAYWLKTCELMICDEAHHASSDQQQFVLSQIPAKYRIGLSATPKLDGPGLALKALCGPILCDVRAIDLIQRGFLSQPRIWVHRVDGKKLDKQADWRTAYSELIVNNQERHAKIVESVRIFRTEEKRCLVLVNQLNHAKQVLSALGAAGIRKDFIHGKVDQDRRDTILSDLSDRRIDVVVAQAETLGEGVDIPCLDVLINATGSSGGGNVKDGDSGRRTLQFLGRTLRRTETKSTCDYVDFADFGHHRLASDSFGRLETLGSEGYGPFIKYWSEYRMA